MPFHLEILLVKDNSCTLFLDHSSVLWSVSSAGPEQTLTLWIKAIPELLNTEEIRSMWPVPNQMYFQQGFFMSWNKRLFIQYSYICKCIKLYKVCSGISFYRYLWCFFKKKCNLFILFCHDIWTSLSIIPSMWGFDRVHLSFLFCTCPNHLNLSLFLNNFTSTLTTLFHHPNSQCLHLCHIQFLNDIALPLK